MYIRTSQFPLGEKSTERAFYYDPMILYASFCYSPSTLCPALPVRKFVRPSVGIMELKAVSSIEQDMHASKGTLRKGQNIGASVCFGWRGCHLDLQDCLVADRFRQLKAVTVQPSSRAFAVDLCASHGQGIHLSASTKMSCMHYQNPSQYLVRTCHCDVDAQVSSEKAVLGLSSGRQAGSKDARLYFFDTRDESIR